MSETRHNLQGFLDKLLSRSILSAKEQQAILDLPGYAAQVSANRDFVRLGEMVDHACLVVDGTVGQFCNNRKGERQITAFHIPGDMANVHSVVLPTATAALQALSTSTILWIPQTAIQAAIRHHPAIAEAVWRDCMVDAAILSQWVVNIGRRDATSRVAHLLCEIATRCSGTPNKHDLTFELCLTQVHLADATGLTPVHVNRTLMALRERGLVTFRSRQVTIHDWEKLSMVGEFDPTYLQAGIKPDERQRILRAA